MGNARKVLPGARRAAFVGLVQGFADDCAKSEDFRDLVRECAVGLRAEDDPAGVRSALAGALEDCVSGQERPA